MQIGMPTSNAERRTTTTGCGRWRDDLWVMGPTSYRAAPPRGDPRSVPDPGERVNTATALRPLTRHVPVPRVGPSAAGGQVLGLDGGDLVGRDAVLRDLRLQTVEPRAVPAENGLLHRPVRRAERLETVLLLHVVRDLEPAHRLDLPLRRAVPQGVRAPDDVVGAEALDQCADEGRGEARVGDGAGRERGAELAVDVLHAGLAGNVGEIARPLDAAGLLELGEHRVGFLHEGAQRGVVHDEVELRPV